MSKPYRSQISWTFFRASARFSFPGMPRMMFSVAVNTSTSLKCWWIMPIPRAKASLGEAMVTGLPSM